MEVNVRKTREGAELLGSVPADISGAQSLEIFPLRDGIYLFSVKGAMPSQKAAAGLSEPERALVKKLLAIRFEKRTPAEVDKALSGAEKSVLAALLEKKVVNIFRSGKYENGVYNVSDSVFGQARDVPAQHTGAPSAGAVPQHPFPAVPAAALKPAYDPLAKGFLVLENEGDARALSSALAERIKDGEVAGLRAFDRKYYYIRKDFALQWQPKIQSLLEKGDKTAEEVSRETRLDAEGCRALLLHMSEEGELLEKSKGKFALA